MRTVLLSEKYTELYREHERKITMKKLLITSLLLSLVIMSGCSAAEKSSSESVQDTTAVSETAAEAETTAESTTREKKVYDYVHGEDGYYNIADEMTEFEMKSQQYGTCWLHAAAASMETAYFKKYGSYPSIEPLDLLDVNSVNGRKEGFFPQEGSDPKETGGWQWILTETLTNGFGDYVIDSSVIIDVNDREAIKEAVKNRGGVAVAVNDTDKKYKGWYGQYYTLNYSKEDYDHDVTIIGYDDHFPKDYFNEPASEDGAWITYNSSLGSAGFFYVSYCAPLEHVISHSVTDKYGEILSHDAGNEQDKYIKTGEWTNTANVFHKSGKLAAVGTYNDFDKQNIKIQIYSADFKDILYTQDAVLDYHGYHTIELDTPVDVSDFAVVISYEKGAPVEGEDIDYGQAEYKTVSESGQSFVLLDDEWKDMTDSDIKKALNINFEPNNCCIKALLAK